MSETEWTLKAALLTHGRAPLLDLRAALAIAEELHSVWPGLTPEEAVRAYWAPMDEPCEV